MNKALISEDNLTNIADAIRAKLQTSDTYNVAEMASAITSIPSRHGPKTIISNGVYNAVDDSLDGYNSVTVQVPMPTYNSGALTATQNGTYNASDNGYDGFNSVTVAVPIPTYNSGTKDIALNGIYNASDFGFDGFSQVNVQVPSSSYNTGVLEVTENGDYNALSAGYDGFNDVHVNVPNTDIVVTENGSFRSSFNYPVTIDASVTSCASMFAQFSSFNQPLEILEGVTNCYYMLGQTAFNQDITIPYTVLNMVYMFYNMNSMNGKNIYIDANANDTRVSAFKMFFNKDGSNRVNVFCSNLSLLNGQSASDWNFIGTDSILWSSITNGYYNSQYNIYLYNNYLGMLTDQSYYQRFQGNASFDLAIKTANTVQNMAFAVNNCSNFNNTVQINDSVTNCVSMFNGCWNFNAPITIGNGVVDMGAMFRNCNNFNQPITIPNTATNCRTMLQGTSYNHPLTIPDKVTNCKWMLFNTCDFNQPLVIGNNVADCQQMVEAYWWDESTQTDRFEGGTFNQAIIFPKSVANANFTLAGQQNMKADIVLHNNACNYSWFLGNSHYEGNIYCPNGIWASKINNMFAGKNNTSGIASIYTPQSYADYNSAIRSYQPTGNSDTWVGDETNELVYSPTANIYIYCNWNGVIPNLFNLNYYTKDGGTLLHQDKVWNGNNGAWSYGDDTWSDTPNGSTITGVKNNITADKNIYYTGNILVHVYTKSTGGGDAAMYIEHGGIVDSLMYTSASSGVNYENLVQLKYPYESLTWGATALKNVTDGTNDYSSGDLIRKWSYSAQQDFYVWERG